MLSATKLIVTSWFRGFLDCRRRSRILARRRAKLVEMGCVKGEEKGIWIHPDVDLAVDERDGRFLGSIARFGLKDGMLITLPAMDEDGEI